MLQVVAGIITDKDGKIFIARRKEGRAMDGFWEFPGGKIEAGEMPKDALLRELKEELCIETEILDFFHKVTYRYPTFHAKLIFYFVKIVRGEVVLSCHDQLAWVLPEELKNYQFLPADSPVIQKLERLAKESENQ